MTVWVFGDSFSQVADVHYSDQWMVKISHELQQDLNCQGLRGSNLEYMYSRFNLQRSNIQLNDIVIINLTGTNRRWFFKDLPGHNLRTSPTDDDRETAAMTAYREYLDNKEITLLYLTNFLYNLHALAKKLNLHVIIMINNSDLDDYLKSKIRTFPLFNIAKGMLSDLSVEEYSRNYIITNYEQFGIVDPRLNHLCRRNHIVLSNKLIANIKHKTPIDLMYGFAKFFVDDDVLKDRSFIDFELFGREP